MGGAGLFPAERELLPVLRRKPTGRVGVSRPEVLGELALCLLGLGRLKSLMSCGAPAPPLPVGVATRKRARLFAPTWLAKLGEPDRARRTLPGCSPRLAD